jgi:hypothetical protein
LRIFNLPGRNVADQLGELDRVAGAFQAAFDPARQGMRCSSSK